MQLQFLGATGTVTGSRTLVQVPSGRMLVDCGLFQGFKQLRLRNWAPFPLDPASIAAVVLTHAHLDHSGYLPLLVKNGFRGKIHCSEATADLLCILLPDSAHLLEEEANYANKHGTSKHSPALPLYDRDDAARALKLLAPESFDKSFAPLDGVKVTMHRAGHILGAALLEVEAEGRRVVFSGDLGRAHDPLMAPPAIIEDADALVVESTYGDRLHDPSDSDKKIARLISMTAARGGVTVIPSFAVGRAQSVLYAIHRLKAEGKIPSGLPVYLNSPMAVDASGLYLRHRADHQLPPAECDAMFRGVQVVNTVEDSIALNATQAPKVIVAASGMATGGRVLHHLKAFAPDARNTILFAGFQAGGTRGAAMLDGAREIKIFGEYVPLRAQVEQLENLSAHADRDEILDWLGHFKRAPRQVFINHGEANAADALRRSVAEKLGWQATVPDYLERFDIP